MAYYDDLLAKLGITANCPYCGSQPWVEICDVPSCNCGMRFIMCMNDDCPEGPEAAGNTQNEMIANWNAGVFVCDPA